MSFDGATCRRDGAQREVVPSEQNNARSTGRQVFPHAGPVHPSPDRRGRVLVRGADGVHCSATGELARRAGETPATFPIELASGLAEVTLLGNEVDVRRNGALIDLDDADETAVIAAIAGWP